MKSIEPVLKFVELLIRNYGAGGTLALVGLVLAVGLSVAVFREFRRKKEIETIVQGYLRNIATLERELNTYKHLHFQSLGKSEEEIKLLIDVPPPLAEPAEIKKSLWSKIKNITRH
jgi:hypothetical protein